VAAVQDNNIGVTGVAPRAKIMAIKASLDSGFFYDSATVPAYIYAANNGAKVFSMSYFADGVSPAEGDALRYCVTQGVLPVAAAGNDSTVYSHYPAAYDGTLSVAALNSSLSKAGFSNFGTWVDVAAPGVGLRTTTVGNGYTDGFAGTSGACPHVAGLAALLFGANPSATAAQVRAAIEDTATPVNQPPYGVYVNYGIINCEAAMLAILGPAAPPRPPEVRAVTGLGVEVLPNIYFPTPRVRMVHVLGRGFATASTASIKMGSTNQPISDRKRDWITAFFMLPVTNPLEVRLDGVLVSTIQMPSTSFFVHPLIDASTPGDGATSLGGFAEALNSDATFVRVTRRDDDMVLLHGTFRKVTRNVVTRLVVRRQFTGTAVGTETVQLYDWSSASYPYGNFITISSGPLPQTMTTSTFLLTNPNRFIDPEGTVYLRIYTSDDLPSSAELHLDMAHLAVR
jgi:hypothetical protein